MTQIKKEKVQKIIRKEYDGVVYNLELETKSDEDDLYWTGDNIVIHNCFPKDINALMYVAKHYGIEPSVMMGAWDKNLEVRPSKEERDWLCMQGRAVSERYKPKD